MDYEIVRDQVDYQQLGVNHAFTHYHKSIEMVYGIKGSLVIYVNGEKFILNEGELILIPPYYSHSYLPDAGQITKVFCLFANESDYYMSVISSEINHQLLLTDKKIAKEIYDTLNEMKKTSSHFMKDGISKYCISKFVEFAPKLEGVTTKDKQLFLKIIDYINIHYKEDVTLESISSVFNYSKCYFSSVFNRLFGKNLNGLLNVIRIQNAIELLGTKTTTEIAYDLGYANLQSFFYNFKKIVGVTPKEYLAKKVGYESYQVGMY